jgi:hypothetical protein
MKSECLATVYSDNFAVLAPGVFPGMRGSRINCRVYTTRACIFYAGRTGYD